MPLLTTCEPAQLSATMTRRQNAEQAAKRAVRRPASAPAARALVDAPQRRSSRIEGKPARNYSEGEQPVGERPERRSRLLDRHSAPDHPVSCSQRMLTRQPHSSFGSSLHKCSAARVVARMV